MIIKDIAAKVENEGLGYMITDYLSPNDIDDPELKEEWIKAQASMKRIEEILEPYTEEF